MEPNNISSPTAISLKGVQENISSQRPYKTTLTTLLSYRGSTEAGRCLVLDRTPSDALKTTVR